MNIKKFVATSAIALAVAGLTFAGVTAAVAATGGPSAFDWLPTSESAQTPNYDKNASGQTVGTYGEAPTADQLPDLVLVETNEGGEGYVLSSEFQPPQFKSPDEALAWQKAGGDKNRTIDAYASDGKTVVGTFTFQASSD